MDLDTTKKLLGGVSEEVTHEIIFAALSGIQNRNGVYLWLLFLSSYYP